MDNNHIHAATSRYYYALYQASRFWADKKGLASVSDSFPDVHATMANIIARNAGPDGREFRQVMNEMIDLRVRADYRPELLGQEEVHEAVRKASAVRGFFLK